MYLYKLYSWRSWMIRDHICLTQSWPAEIQHQEQLHQCLVVRVAMAVGTGSSLQCARWVIRFHRLSCSHSSSRFGVGMATGSWSFGRDLVKVVLFFPDGKGTWSGNLYPTYVSMSLKVWSPGTSEKPAGAELCWSVLLQGLYVFSYFKIPVALDRNCSAFFQYWEDGVVRLFGVIFHCFDSIFIFFSALHVLGCCSSTSFLELPCFLVRQSISVLLSESQSIDFKARHLKARSFSTSSLYLMHLIVSWFKFNLNL